MTSKSIHKNKLSEAIIQKISSQHPIHQSSRYQQNIQKVKLFISCCDQDIPLLTSQMIKSKTQISSILRIYFNDQGFLFFKDHYKPLSYLEDKDFQTHVYKAFCQFLNIHKTKLNLNKQPNIEQHKALKSKQQIKLNTHQLINQLKKDNIHKEKKTINHQNTQIHNQDHHKVIKPIQEIVQNTIQLLKVAQVNQFAVQQIKKQAINELTAQLNEFSAQINENKTIQQIKQTKKQPNQQVKQTKKQSTKHLIKPQKSKRQQIAIKIDFIDFIQSWIKSQKDLFVYYENYNRIFKSQVQTMLNNLARQVSSIIAKLPAQKKTILKVENGLPFLVQIQTDQTKQNNKMNQNKNGKNPNIKVQNIKQSKSIQSLQNPINKSIIKLFNSQQNESTQNHSYYLKKIYQHYCKKSLSSVKDKQFGTLIQYYNSVNLLKFMHYCKDMKFNTLNKKFNVKYFQKLYTHHQNINKSLDFQQFKQIVQIILQTAFNDINQLQSKGYQLIGVKDRQSFTSLMNRLGVLVPLRKIVFKSASKPVTASKHLTASQTILRQSKIISSHTQNEKVEKEVSRYIKNGGYNHGYESNWDSQKIQPQILLNEKQRKQQKLLQNLSISKLHKLQPSKLIDSRMHQLIDQDYDPYLKRYNDRNSLMANTIVPSHKIEPKNKIQKTKIVPRNNIQIPNNNEMQNKLQLKNSHGMLKRMDERIQNFVNKIR